MVTVYLVCLQFDYGEPVIKFVASTREIAEQRLSQYLAINNVDQFDCNPKIREVELDTEVELEW